MKFDSKAMREGPILKSIIIYTVPIIFTGLLQLFFNAADLIVVGRFCGSDSVAAVGATGSVTNLIINLFIGLSVGAGAAAAQEIGAGNDESVSATVHTAVCTAVVSGIFLTAVGLLFSKKFLILMGTPNGKLLKLAVLYMQIYFCGMVFSMLYNFGSAILRAAGDTQSPLVFLTAAGVLNVLLNVLFVTVFKLDVAGVALATVVSQALSAALVLCALSRRKDACRLEMRKLRIHKNALFRIIKIGVPAGLQGALFTVSHVLVQSSVNSFGAAYMSGAAASSSIEGFCYTAMNAFQHTALNFCGQCFGARDLKRVRRVTRVCLITVAVTGLIVGNILYVFGRPLLEIYITDSPTAVNYGMEKLLIMLVPYFLCGTLETITGAMRGIGSSVTPTVITVFGSCVMRIVWIYTVFALPKYHTFSGLYISFPISWVLTFAALYIAYLIIMHHKEKMIKRSRKMPKIFEIDFNYERGTVVSLKKPDDKAHMNWVEGTEEWGMIKGAEVVSVEKNENGLTAVYRTKHLLVTVQRQVLGDKYRESYCFENYHDYDVFFNRGAVGIYATFNDNYDKASICMTQKCHTHLWCGGNSSYIRAVKMGPCNFGLGLVLTEGSLDTYSIERDLKEQSNDRGDFILHPSVFNLRPGEKMNMKWELFWYKDGAFCAAIEPYDSVLLIDAENYTVYSDEDIVFSVNRPNVSVLLDGAQVQAETKNGRTYVKYKPQRLGNHDFCLEYGKRETKAQFFVQIPFKELARKRAEFITQKQQFHREGDSLDGAYLIYDNQDKCLIYDEIFSDYNASRERLVMGLFIAKYLQYDRDEKMYESLMKYYKFVSREFFDEESGAVYNAVGKNPARKRLYNAPWMSVFMLEMYNLTGETVYLDRMYKLLCVYYEIGGERFYPNGLSMFETVEALKKAGKAEKAEKLTAMYRKHIDNIIKIGTSYPEHEVRYEQTIVTPAVTLIAQMYQITHDKSLIEECRKQLMVLEKFNGRQPTHYMNDLAVRHWDGYWFGKRMLYGDTFPHSASIHSSDAFLHYYMITGDEEWKKRAVCGARNNLSVYRSDGSASCTRLHPLFVNGVRGEYYDEFANEQDGLLYFMIKFFHAM